MNTYIPWTDEELEFLKANYARLSWEELTSKLRRSKAAILHKAQSLRIFRLKSKTKIFTKKCEPTLIPFIKFLDARYFVCHVKPDFSLFFIKEVDINKKRFSSCLSEIRKIALREAFEKG